jgi:hypothetical protein
MLFVKTLGIDPLEQFVEQEEEGFEEEAVVEEDYDTDKLTPPPGVMKPTASTTASGGRGSGTTAGGGGGVAGKRKSGGSTGVSTNAAVPSSAVVSNSGRHSSGTIRRKPVLDSSSIVSDRNSGAGSGSVVHKRALQPLTTSDSGVMRGKEGESSSVCGANGGDGDDDEEEEEDVDEKCLVCGEGGVIMLCDFPSCKRVYHQVTQCDGQHNFITFSFFFFFSKMHVPPHTATIPSHSILS